MSYYGIDYGGTKLRIGQVNPDSGSLIELTTLDSAKIRDNASLFQAVRRHLPEHAQVGISAAGDIDEDRRIIRFSPNSMIDGEISLGADLQSAGYNVVILNDIRAATQGEAWFGAGNRNRAICVATYSTGFNCAFAREGLVSSRQAEVGHSLYPGGMSLKCGCGGLDHLENYVSGGGAAQMARRLLYGRSPTHRLYRMALAAYNERHNGSLSPEDLTSDPALQQEVLELLDAAMIYRAYRDNPVEQPQHNVREIQCRAIAVSLSLMIHFYNRLDRILLMGSQTKDWDILFEPAIAEVFDVGMMSSLPRPSISPTSFEETGVIGAVAYHLATRGRAS